MLFYARSDQFKSGSKKKKSLISVLDGLSLLYNMFYRKRAMFVQKEVPER